MMVNADGSKAHGDCWLGRDGRLYVMVMVGRYDSSDHKALVPMLVATGAEQSHLPPAIESELGKDAEIGIRAVGGRIQWVKPDLGPLAFPWHANDGGGQEPAGGVLGMDVLSQIEATIDFTRGLVVS